MSIKAEDLDIAIKKVCPIQGVSCGNLADPTTWLIHYDVSATESQKLEAQKVLAKYSPDSPSLLEQKDAALVYLKQTDIKLLRYIEERDLGQTPYLSPEEYITMLKNRQTQRQILSQ